MVKIKDNRQVSRGPVASIRQMSRQVSRGSDGEYQADEQAGVARLNWRVSGRVTQSCLTLCDPVACSPPGSSVHGILQARILEWVAISFSRGVFPTQGSNPGLLHCRQML